MKKLPSSLIAPMALLFLCAIGGSEAMAADLITPLPAEKAPTHKTAPHVAAQERVRIDVTRFTTELKASRKGKPVILNLLSGVSIPLILDRTDPCKKDHLCFAAHSPGDPENSSTSTIVIHNDKVLKTVYAVLQYKNATYEISHIENGVHSVSKINQSAYPRD